MMVRLNDVEWYDRDSLLNIYSDEVERDCEKSYDYYINFITKVGKDFNLGYDSKENRDYWLNKIINQINNSN